MMLRKKNKESFFRRLFERKIPTELTLKEQIDQLKREHKDITKINEMFFEKNHKLESLPKEYRGGYFNFLLQNLKEAKNKGYTEKKLLELFTKKLDLEQKVDALRVINKVHLSLTTLKENIFRIITEKEIKNLSAAEKKIRLLLKNSQIFS